MRPSHIYLVEDPADSRTHWEHVMALHDLAAGRAVCELTAGGRNAFWLAQDVLDGLGKRPDGLSGGREAWMSLDRAAVWLAGEAVKVLFVARADERDAGAWRSLFGLAAQSGCELWLLTNAQMLPRGHREFLHEWGAERTGWQAFTRRWPRSESRAAPREPSPAARATPTMGMPRDDFPSFRAACRRLLNPKEFKHVDAEFRGAQSKVGALAKSGRFDRDEALTLVRELLEEATSLDARVARLRGAQVAFFDAGFLLSVRLDLLASSFENAARSCLDSRTTEALREHHHTRAVAAAVLGLLTGASPVELVGLSMSSVRPGAAAVRVASQWQTVPVHARGLLNAHRHQRLLEGATEDEPFLAVRARGGEFTAMTPENLRKELGRLSRLSGLLLVSSWTRHTDESVSAWHNRRGIALRPLPGVAGSAIRQATKHSARRRRAT